MAVNSPVMITQLYTSHRCQSMDDELALQEHNHGTIPMLPSIHDTRAGAMSALTRASERASYIRQPTLSISRRAKSMVSYTTQLSQNRLQSKQQMCNKDGSMSPEAAIVRYRRIMSEYEVDEIKRFAKVWFVGPTAQKLKISPRDVGLRNFGYDNEKGRYLVVRNDHIAYRFEVLKCLGKGSFGDVMKVYDHQKKEYCALKIIRNEPRFHHQAELEIKILDILTKKDTQDRMNVIHMKEHFVFRGHTCLTFDLLKCDLYSDLKRTGFRGFSLPRIASVSKGIVNALRNLRRSRIVHCDLKPENILLTHEGGDEIKVIDFGSSCFAKDQVHTYIQSRFYRAPEIILGAFPYGCPIDMWSLGCILVELFTGKPLFPGHSEAEQLMYQVEYLGTPSETLLRKSKRLSCFFDANTKLKPVKDRRGRPKTQKKRSLDHVLGRAENAFFSDFVRQCLVWDPEKRMTPREASRHPFLTGKAHTNTPVTPTQAGEDVERRLSEPPHPTDLDLHPALNKSSLTSMMPTPTTKGVAQVNGTGLSRSHSNSAVNDGVARKEVFDRDGSGSNLFGQHPQQPQPPTSATTTATPAANKTMSSAVSGPRKAPRLGVITENM